MRRPTVSFIGIGRLTLAAGVALVTAALAAPLAQQPAPAASSAQQKPPAPAGQQPAAPPAGQQPAAPAQQPVTPPAKPLVPLAASTLANKPDAYVGEPVTVMGAIESSLSATSFSMDQDPKNATGKDILVVAPTLHEKVELNGYVTVIGEAMKFDPDEVAKKAKDYKLDLPPDVVAKYRGKAAVLATAVINSAMVDLAKPLPPPMTADDLALQKIMKQLPPAQAALRKGLEASDVKIVKEQLAVLRPAFMQTEAFWKPRGAADALKFAQDGRGALENIDKAAAAAKWDEVKTAVGALGQTCQGCHAAHRDRFDDGTFRIKKVKG